jgi:hypothetical protein
MKQKIVTYLAVLLCVSLLLIPTGCLTKDRFERDPIKWSFVDGDGAWNTNSRKWTVYLKPGETKSVTIQLYNSDAVAITEDVVLWGPPDTIALRGSDLYPITAGGSMDITITAIAYQIAKTGSHKYIVNCGNSTNNVFVK